MPYGIPNETPEQTEKMESCVEQVMADHKGEEGFDKTNAIKICKSRIMGTLIEIVQDPSEINAVLGGNYLPGELLRWENMELAAAGVNGNQDELSDEQITSIAMTLPLMPLDDNHRQDDVVGIFTAAYNTEGRLLTDGIIYARRFPEIASDVLAGRRFPSIEAHADVAVCSMCGGEFATTGEYCDHLRNKFHSGAVRSFKGEVRGVGGAVVRNPAHKAAAFDPGSIYMVAAHEVDAKEKELPNSVEPNKNKSDGGDMKTVEEIQAELDNALSKLAKLEEEKTGLQATSETLQASLNEATAKVEALETELEGLRTANTELVEANRRNTLREILTDEEFAEQKDVIMAMSEEAVTLFAAKAKPPKAPGHTEPKVNLDPPEDDTITLA